MRHAKEIPADTVADFVARYGRGQTLFFIGFATDYAPGTVRNALVKAGVKIRRRGRSSSGNWGYTGGVE